MLSYYKKLTALRKSPEYRETFTYGKCVPKYEDEEEIFAYCRVPEDGGRQILVAANFGKEPHTLKLDSSGAEILLTNTADQADMKKEIKKKQELTLSSCGTAVLLL